MIKIDINKCNGCSACSQKCPLGCITMKESFDGFYYPSIDANKCIECGLCENACPLNGNFEIKFERKTYACINTNELIREKSSSGGVFSEMAKWILDQSGVVYGCEIYDNEVKHVRVCSYQDLERLRGSKYVQSKVINIYNQIQSDLKSGIVVLFCGTPCQANALRLFLGKDYNNLYIVDIICHGVISDDLLKEHLNYLKEKHGSEDVQIVSFRDKRRGWREYSLKYTVNGKVKSVSKEDDFMLRAFNRDIALRESCYNCEIKGKNRASDITLGDLWGVENINPSLDDNKGVSAIIINSVKGVTLFDRVKSSFIYEQIDIGDIEKYNKSYVQKSYRNPARDNFYRDIQNNYVKNMKEYTDYSRAISMVLKTKKIIRKVIKRK